MGCIADDAVLPDVCGVLARFEDRVSAIAWSSVCLSDPDSGIPYQENEEKKLKALNVLEQDVVVKPKDRFICMGTVLGKVQGMPDL